MNSKCGTYAGYQAHGYYKTPKCDPCLRANAEYHVERRRSSPSAREYDRKYHADRRRAEREQSASGVRS